jgi:TM2 domain-containing membrane protein YozV
MFCQHCGAQMNDDADVCVRCGRIVNVDRPKRGRMNNEWLLVALLCFFLGGLGVHRFYVGKMGTGVLQLLTCGGCGIWALIDFIMILTGNFTDANGRRIENN